MKDFFPTDVLDPFVVEWFSKHLIALQEPSLWDRISEAEEAHRFLWLRTFHQPVCIRALEDSKARIELIVKVTSGQGGYEPGDLIINETRVLKEIQWNDLRSKIGAMRFWELPTTDNRIGVDGAEWVFEGVRASQYHMIDRWSPESGPDFELGMNFLRVADLTVSEIY